MSIQESRVAVKPRAHPILSRGRPYCVRAPNQPPPRNRSGFLSLAAREREQLFQGTVFPAPPLKSAHPLLLQDRAFDPDVLQLQAADDLLNGEHFKLFGDQCGKRLDPDADHDVPDADREDGKGAARAGVALQ